MENNREKVLIEFSSFNFQKNYDSKSLIPKSQTVSRLAARTFDIYFSLISSFNFFSHKSARAL